MAADGIAWHKISVKGDRAESLEGKWHVDVYVNDMLYKSNSFTFRKSESMFVDVDVNVPRTAMKNPDAVAVVIGNKITGIKMCRRLNTPSGMLTPSANIWSKHWAIVKKTS
ncbi:MAG: hypothetical protein R2874_11350 [Desulfobacterales bacterium]